jgi:hypothetical protein
MSRDAGNSESGRTRRDGGPDAASEDDAPVLPRLPRDEQDVGWGDEPAERDDEWYRRERPPHHG